MAWVIGVIIAVLLASRTISEIVVEYQWWKEMGQVATWETLIIYGFLPQLVAGVVTFIVLWIAHARGMKLANRNLRDHRVYAIAVNLGLAFFSFLYGRAISSEDTLLFLGAQRTGGAATPWRDPVFFKPLTFYLLELPFLRDAVVFVAVLFGLAAVVTFVTSRAWLLGKQLRQMEGSRIVVDLFGDFNLDSKLVRVFLALAAFTMAAYQFLERYGVLLNSHPFLTGADYVDAYVRVPLQYVDAVGFVLAGLLVLTGRWKWVLTPVIFTWVLHIIPAIVSGVYVKPNELALQRPFINSHIEATRSAFALDAHLKEIQHPGKFEAPIDVNRNRPLLENVRLWDWRAFHDTVTQLQALRQYYVFADTDVDRYMIDGQLRQLMVTPREMDIRQLPDARANWINGHFIYTHGYGMVVAEANKITPNGQPVFLIEDAPPRVNTKSLKLERPELYFGEVTHEPVFVRTQQKEFNYPAGSDNVQNQYEGKAGIPITSFGLRLAAALAYADRNILLTGYLTSDSRMLIHRNVRQRLSKLASFIDWDIDPYLVLQEDGRLVWMVDGYTTSARHPYSRQIDMPNTGRINYIRNAVKATVDAYDGTANLYVFDTTDPLILAWRAMFPTLFKPASDLPQGLRTHIRYPERLFTAQTEMYRTFHMRSPEAFYNKEDLWDIAKNVYAQAQQSEGLAPTYIVATLPGEPKPEFLLVQSFTPRSKDNLIGFMAVRCDPEHYGEIVVLQLSKQSLIYGPLQIEARIDSDQNISKDLTLWNQQGSQVLRGQMLVLPMDDTFLYVEPIYIQSSQARMPQLKKVVLAMGNTLIYRDTFDQALAELGGAPAPTANAPAQTSSDPPPPAAPSATERSSDSASIEAVRQHLRRYRELSSQGRWSEAGKELEALEKLVGR